jgi:hypothetical protein
MIILVVPPITSSIILTETPGWVTAYWDQARHQMDAATLDRLVGKAKFRVFGSEDAANEPQRNVLAVLIKGFDQPRCHRPL